VLANPAYVGEYCFNRIDGKTQNPKPASEWVKLAVDPIIEPAIFRRALYEGIEQGVLKLDDTLRQRTDKLQAQRQAILTDIARLKTKATVPAHIMQKKHIDTFTRLVREKLLENGAFAKEYLRLLVHEIRVNKRQVQITGSYAAPFG
jgi:hypothetical protein